MQDLYWLFYGLNSNPPKFQLISLKYASLCSVVAISIFFFFFFFFFRLFRAAPAAYGISQALGQIRAMAASLPHSHSSAGSEPRLRPTPQLTAMQDP